jgi:uncharacterized lipoprotein NlpE involved in copper resistance
VVSGLRRALVGVCALKLAKLILAAVLVFALLGCNDQSSSGVTGSTAQDTPTGNGVATLAWEAPTTTTTGAALTNLAGYRIYYGLDANNLADVVNLNGLGVETYMVENLSVGTWYFAIKAVTAAGVESPLSNVVSKTIN